MSDVNVTLSGYVGSEVEFKEGFARSGERLAHNDRAFFRLGSTPRFFDRASGRWRDGETVWLTVKVWRTLAHHVASSISIGHPVVVVGKLRTSVWKGEDDQVHSRDVLEASVVGHDLNRGTTAFSRSTRAVEQQDPVPDDDVETMVSLETAPGTMVNTATGELRGPADEGDDGTDAAADEDTRLRDPEPAF
jgi:single-strand DNA-binding protein